MVNSRKSPQKNSKSSPAIPDLSLSDPDKMRAIQIFVSGTMHEIQYPLKGLLSYTQQLLDKYAQKGFEYISFKEFQEIIRVIEKIRDQVQHSVETTERVLEINKKRIGISDHYCDVLKVIRESIKMVDQYLTISNVNIKFDATQKLPSAALSSIELNQILIHVINNAIQSIPLSGGNIKIRVHYKLGDEFIRIDCQDDGVGIPEENIPRIFEPFFTTKERGISKNIGLGLTIVYSIIRACKGSITVKSDLRKGTLVQLFLPISKK